MPSSVALFNIKEKTFIIMKNKIGERGSPWRNPVLLLKYPEDTPLIMIEKEGEQMHVLI